MAGTAAAKAPTSLADSLSRRAPDPTPEYLSTLGLNRRTGVVNDPYRVGNMPATHIARAFTRAGGQLTQARARGWIPFEPDQVSRNEHDADKAFIPDYDTDNGFVVVGFGNTAMVMCYANKTIVAANEKVVNDRWNARLRSQLVGSEKPGVLPRKDTGYTGGYTTDRGNQAAVGYEESTASIDPNDLTSDLFPTSERE